MTIKEAQELMIIEAMKNELEKEKQSFSTGWYRSFKGEYSKLITTDQIEHLSGVRFQEDRVTSVKVVISKEGLKKSKPWRVTTYTVEGFTAHCRDYRTLREAKESGIKYAVFCIEMFIEYWLEEAFPPHITDLKTDSEIYNEFEDWMNWNLQQSLEAGEGLIALTPDSEGVPEIATAIYYEEINSGGVMSAFLDNHWYAETEAGVIFRNVYQTCEGYQVWTQAGFIALESWVENPEVIEALHQTAGPNFLDWLDESLNLDDFWLIVPFGEKPQLAVPRSDKDLNIDYVEWFTTPSGYDYHNDILFGAVPFLQAEPQDWEEKKPDWM